MSNILSEEQKAQLTPNAKLLLQAMEARRRGDQAEVDRLHRLIDFPPEALMAAKRSAGAEWVKEKGFKTEAVEAKYGRNWLEQDD